MKPAIIIILLLAVMPASVSAFDEFDDSYSPKHFQLISDDLSLTIKGELEVEFHDLEGQGGAGFDSPTDTRTIGTRSPFVEVDSFWLALRLGLSPWLAANSLLDFSSTNATLAAAWFDSRYVFGRYEQHIEIGLHTPFVKIDRRSERYPLIGTIYWREPELHAIYQGRLPVSDYLALELGLSLAMMRPLWFAGVQESTAQRGTINVLAYDQARVFSGNSPVYGLRLKTESIGFFLEAFGFIGKLSNQAGIDELRNGFGNFMDLPGYDPEATIQNDDFYWFGGRAGYDGHNIHTVVEYIQSKESLIRRAGFYAQISYEIHLYDRKKWFFIIEPLVRYEEYKIFDSTKVHASGRALRSPALGQAISWDYQIITGAVIVHLYRELLKLRVEYYQITEHNGVPALGIDNVPFKNNELLTQIELRF
jgi:hypothetical protein